MRVEFKEKYKCKDCVWGTWTGLKYKCALPKCNPQLGKLNGVGESEQTKEI